MRSRGYKSNDWPLHGKEHPIEQSRPDFPKFIAQMFEAKARGPLLCIEEMEKGRDRKCDALLPVNGKLSV